MGEKVEAALGKAPAPISPPHPAVGKPQLARIQATEKIKDPALTMDTPSSRETTLLVEEGMVAVVVMVIVVFLVVEVINEVLEPTKAVMGEGMVVMEVDTSTRIQTTKFLALIMLTVLVMEAVVVNAALHFITESKQ